MRPRLSQRVGVALLSFQLATIDCTAAARVSVVSAEHGVEVVQHDVHHISPTTSATPGVAVTSPWLISHDDLGPSFDRSVLTHPDLVRRGRKPKHRPGEAPPVATIRDPDENDQTVDPYWPEDMWCEPPRTFGGLLCEFGKADRQVSSRFRLQCDYNDESARLERKAGRPQQYVRSPLYTLGHCPAEHICVPHGPFEDDLEYLQNLRGLRHAYVRIRCVPKPGHVDPPFKSTWKKRFGGGDGDKDRDRSGDKDNEDQGGDGHGFGASGSGGNQQIHPSDQAQGEPPSGDSYGAWKSFLENVDLDDSTWDADLAALVVNKNGDAIAKVSKFEARKNKDEVVCRSASWLSTSPEEPLTGSGYDDPTLLGYSPHACIPVDEPVDFDKDDKLSFSFWIPAAIYQEPTYLVWDIMSRPKGG